MFAVADKQIERLVAQGLPRRFRGLAVGAVLALLLAVTWLHAWSGRYELDLYFVVVAGACFLFREHGLWIIPTCLVMSDATEHHWDRHVLVHNVEQLLEWGFLAFFINVTLSKYTQVRRYQGAIQQDLALARTLQRALLSNKFESDSVCVDARIHQTRQIGGDFYYFRPFSKKYVVFCLGDIMGKGIPASMVMAIVMGFFYEWGKQSFSPRFILERLNERLYSLWEEESWFATMFYGIYDEETHELIYSSGGHQPALRFRRDAAAPVEYLTTEGLPVGIFEEVLWEERRVVLEAGDRLVVFTDGVNEARNPAGEQFGVERVEAVVRRHADLPASSLARHVASEVRRWVARDNLDDDICVLVVDIKR
jgi:serine phosphatase RsbU (regulator of sigma subunit)